MTDVQCLKEFAHAAQIPLPTLQRLAILHHLGEPELVAAVGDHLLPLKKALRLARLLTKPQQARLVEALRGMGKRERLALVALVLKTRKMPGGARNG